MSNAPGPRRRPRGGLHLPRSAWPIATGFAATPDRGAATVDRAIEVATRELASRLAGARRRSVIRAVTIDADETDAVLSDLNVPADAQLELRAFCREHPAGRLVIVWADYEPDTRRMTVL